MRGREIKAALPRGDLRIRGGLSGWSAESRWTGPKAESDSERIGGGSGRGSLPRRVGRLPATSGVLSTEWSEASAQAHGGLHSEPCCRRMSSASRKMSKNAVLMWSSPLAPPPAPERAKSDRWRAAVLRMTALLSRSMRWRSSSASAGPALFSPAAGGESAATFEPLPSSAAANLASRSATRDENIRRVSSAAALSEASSALVAAMVDVNCECSELTLRTSSKIVCCHSVILADSSERSKSA
mmetsp:Transcript_106545/g.306398  ORF Transcript_106545/g.306398 Transcript_106545/m.306398 type:complete len:242 (+) Transcript_106545:2053-2778(+)